MKTLHALLVLVLLFLSGQVSVRADNSAASSAAGTVDTRGESGVTFAQRTDGSKLVDIYYTLSGGTTSVALGVSLDGGTTFSSVNTLSGDIGSAITEGTSKQIVWNAGTDYANSGSSRAKFRVTALLEGAGGTFAPIPGGTYSMGNVIGDSGMTDAGTVSVTLSPYYMAVNDTTKAQWDAVRTWALSHGYPGLTSGAGKASNHPVQAVTWYDALKWANAASEKEGLTPCYKLSGAVFRTGTNSAVTCDWTVNGYRLPTEAEWEVAARGGLSGKRFPWGDTISQSQANYKASTSYAYDLSGSVNNYHPTYATGGMPYTSPVGSFAANGYGLYDMSGNVYQWCWDWYGTPYLGASDPRGVVTGSLRVLRGGAWDNVATFSRSALRGSITPTSLSNTLSFRLARSRPTASGTGTVSIAGTVDTTPPVLTVSGTSVIAASGSGAVISLTTASATDNIGTPSITYSPLSGGTFAIGTTTVTATATDSVGNVISGTFTVTVSVPLTISAQPTSLATTSGSSATLSVTATGTAPITYQWRKNGTNISGATSASYALASVSAGDEASYDVLITNPAGTVTSEAASLTVNLPAPSAVTFAQRTDGSKLVDIYYTLTGGTTSVALGVSLDGGTTFTSVKTTTGDVGTAVTAGTSKHIVWNAGTDYPASGTVRAKMRLTALLDGAGGTFAPIPGGTYSMGNLLGDSDIADAGTVSVSLSPYYMAVNDTTKAQWDTVRTWGASNGYTDLAAGAGKASTHPVQTVSWYDAVKWANAASEKEGLTPCYKVSGAVLRTVSSGTVVCDWTANGYRLPTEAEWEVAARGGLSGKRFPWGDTISQSQANYKASTSYAYDLSGAVNNYHPTYATGGMPYTSSAGVFAANGCGLNDMAGNVLQWCWDWYGTPYSGGSDPRGSATGSARVLRGGRWNSGAYYARSANRYADDPTAANNGSGFRLARGRFSSASGVALSGAGTLDTTPPVLTVSGISAIANSGSGAVIALTTASATDNIGTPSIAYSPASGSLFAVGNTTVTATAADTFGNLSSGTFAVNVKVGETRWIVWDGAPVSYPKYANGVQYAERATGYLILPSSLGGRRIDVTYTGEVAAYSEFGGSTPAFAYDQSFLAQSVLSLPPVGNFVALTGESGLKNEVSFVDHITGKPVAINNLLMAIGSLGGEHPAKFTFDHQMVLVSHGPGFWGPEIIPLQVLASNSIYGQEANGVVQFNGAISSFSWTVPNRETYVVFNLGVTDMAGLAVSVPPTDYAGVSITKDPSNLTLLEGGSGALSVQAGGVGLLAYQWRKDGVAISGATGATCQITSAVAASAGLYDVLVSNSEGNVTSSAAVVVVNCPAAITLQPVSMSRPVGTVATFTVTATGTDPITYQWRKGGVNILAGTSSSYSIPATVSSDEASYDVMVANAFGSVTSSSVTLTVNPPVSITAQPGSLAVTRGSSANLSVTVTGGTAPITYQWRKNGTNILGATSASYALASVSAGDEGAYDVVVTDAAGSITSAPATLTVNLPVPSAVTFAQRTDGSKLVDIAYTLTGGTTSVALGVSLDGGTTFTSMATLTGDVGAAITAGTGKHIVWDAGTDYPNSGTVRAKMRITPLLDGAGGSFAPIPGGAYSMGNLVGDGDITNAGTVSVTLSPYYLSVNDTTKAQWDVVRTWGASNGYTDLPAGGGKAANHPVQTLMWYDAVKWANAASEKDGLTPCYRVGGAVYRTTQNDAVTCDWSANGYRLPTEAEWEVAARGGLSGKRFPWGNTLSQSQANYKASATYTYDASGSVNNYHPAYATGGNPYTSPVASFAANGYGLYDMAGNVAQWCWDWYGASYSGGSNPRGASTGNCRIQRGTAWGAFADDARSAARAYNFPTDSTYFYGFRLARGRPTGLGGGTLSASGVVDTLPPVLSLAGTSTFASSGSGMVVALSTVSAVDNTGSSTLVYSPASGSLFAVGTTTVTATATDTFGNVSSGTFAVTVGAPVSIAAQPTGVTVTAGSSATFSVVAAGAAPFSYQWRKGGVAISGATSAAYTLANAQTVNAGSYSVLVSNPGSSVTSDAALLTVNSSVIITQQPVSAVLNPGANATFSVTATGTAPLSYQWRKNGTAIAGATSSSYTLAGAGAGDAGGYDVVVTNPAGSVNSNLVSLGLNTPVVITTQPAGGALNPGGSTTLSVEATGTGPLTYQWRKNGANIAGATNATYALTNAKSASAGVYDVVVGNMVGSVTSLGATVSVNTAVSITTQPVSAAVVLSQTASFSVAATGTAPMTYQWRKAGVAISGGTAASYTIASVQVGDAGAYDVVVTNPVGSVTSSAATLSVILPASVVTAPAPVTVTLGAPATLSIKVSGTGPFTYQWRKDGVAIAGATGASYAIASAKAANAGSYDVVITNAAGSVTSGAAALTVNLPVSIVTQPASAEVAEGSSVTLSVSATGSGSLSYQWYRDGVLLSGATSATYQIKALSSKSWGSYTVEVSNFLGTVTSAKAQIVIAGPPVIYAHPASQTVAAGVNATLSAKALCISSFWYQWKKNGVLIGAPVRLVGGGTPITLTYTIYDSTTEAEGLYTVVAYNALGSVESTPAIVQLDVAFYDARLLRAGRSFDLRKVPNNGYVDLQGKVPANDVLQMAMRAGSGASYWWSWGPLGLGTYTPIAGQTGTSIDFSTPGLSKKPGQFMFTVKTSKSTRSIRFLVTSWGAATGVTAGVVNPLTVLVPPSSITVSAGGVANFGVKLSGSASAYSWYKVGASGQRVLLSSGSSPFLSLSNVSSTNAGRYFVVASDDFGNTVESAQAVLTIVPAGE